MVSVAVVAAAVGILISFNEDHEVGSVVQPSDLTSLGVPWTHSSPVQDCAAVGCLDSGLVIGPRALQVDETDLSFAATVFRGSFGRAYRSDLVGGDDVDAVLGRLFGPGWFSVFDSQLSIEPAGAELVTPPTNDQVAAIGRLDGAVSALWGSGELWQFDRSGRVTRLESPTGRSATVDWDGDDLSAVSFDGGQSFQVSTDADGHVAELTGSDGRTVTYRYVDGRLAGASGPSGDSTYSYSEDGLLESASIPSGETDVAYDDAGHVSELSTGATQSLEVSGAAPTVTVHDGGRESTSVYEFDSAGRLVRAVTDGAQLLARSFDDSGRLVRSDAPGQHVEVSYDGGGRVSRVVENDAATGYVYDSLGRTVQVTAADGGVTAYGYEGPSALPSSVTDPGGGVTELSYGDGRLAKVVDPDGVAIRYRYDDAGNLVSVTDGNGAETTFAYDEAGRMVGTESPEGARSQASFDDAGRVQVAGAPDGTRTAYSYNTAGQPTAVISPQGVSSFTYDGDGQLAAQTGPTGARVDYGYTDGDVTAVGVTPSGSSGPLEVGLTSDTNGGISARGPGGETRVVAYSDGRPSEIDLPGGRRESLRYDAGGRLTEVRIDGTVAASHIYDAAGRLVRTEDSNGLVEERSYDQAGRLVEIRYPDGTKWTATWTAGGRIESVTTPEGRLTTWSYDDTGQVDTMTSPMGSTVQIDHDRDGHVTGLTEQDGVSWSYQYDPGGRLATADTPAGPVNYRWDGQGRLISRVDSGGEQSQWLYDYQGRLYNVKLPGEHNDLDWAYDDFGNVSSWEQGDQRWEVERDAAGRATSVDVPEGDEYTVEWDDAGNPVQLQYDDTTEQRSFDALGRVVEATYGDDDTFEYHRDGATTAIVDQGDDDPEPVVQFERDGRGRVVGVLWGSDDDEQVRAEWDYAGRPVTISSGDHQATITRDDDGRPTEVTRDGDTVLTAAYENGQIASIATPDDDLLALDYDEGHVSRAQSGDVTVAFDQEGRPDTFGTSGDDGRFRYADDGTVTGLQYGEDLTTATPGTDELETDGDAGSILQSVFEPDGSFRGLPAADAVPQFTYLDGLPDEFTPGGLTPSSPEVQIAQTVAAIDVTVPEPLKLDGSPEDIASAAAETILTAPLVLPVHPASTALVALFNDDGDPQAISPVGAPVWDGLLGGIADRQDTTGTFDWVTAQITNLSDWTTAALSAVARSVINGFTDPVTLIAVASAVALTEVCKALPTCPLHAIAAINGATAFFGTVLTGLLNDEGIADLALQATVAAAFAVASTYAFVGAFRLVGIRAAVPVAAEVQLDDAVLGTSRAVQSNRANAALEEALAANPRLAARLEELSPGAADAVSRNGGRATPDGFTWHHAHSSTVNGRIGVMQLVRTEVHAPGSIWQDLLHPGGVGGYTEWAIPRGAPSN